MWWWAHWPSPKPRAVSARHEFFVRTKRRITRKRLSGRYSTVHLGGGSGSSVMVPSGSVVFSK